MCKYLEIKREIVRRFVLLLVCVCVSACVNMLLMYVCLCVCACVCVCVYVCVVCIWTIWTPLSLTCQSFLWCHITGPSTVDGHNWDSVECVTDQPCEDVSVHWWSVISYDDHWTTAVIDGDIVAGWNPTSSGRGPGHCELSWQISWCLYSDPGRTRRGWKERVEIKSLCQFTVQFLQFRSIGTIIDGGRVWSIYVTYKMLKMKWTHCLAIML